MMNLLAVLNLSLVSATTATHGSAPAHLPKHAAIQEAISYVETIDVHVTNLVAIAQGQEPEGGNKDHGDMVEENDHLASRILLGVSRKTQQTLDKLDQLDAAVASMQWSLASTLKNEVCTGLDQLKKDNKKARDTADYPNIGNLTSNLPDFLAIDETVDDTKDTVLCP